jgi:hypothetical protein
MFLTGSVNHPKSKKQINMRAFLAILISLGSLLADDALVEEAYIYGFPLVVMDANKGVMTAATSLT